MDRVNKNNPVIIKIKNETPRSPRMNKTKAIGAENTNQATMQIKK